MDPEDLFNAVRRAKAAQEALNAGVKRPGAILDLPSHIMMPGPTGKMRTWGLRIEQEPGSVVAPGIHQVGWSLRTYDGVHTGNFLVLISPPHDRLGRRRPGGLETDLAMVAARKGPMSTSEFAESTNSTYRPTYLALRHLASMQIMRKTGNVWELVVDQLPAHAGPALVYAEALPPRQLVRQLQLSVINGERALSDIIRQYDRMIWRQVRALRGRLEHTSGVFSNDDAHAVGQQVVAKLALKFASNDRPVCTFSRAVMDTVYRDVVRASNKATGETIMLGECRAWLYNHPNVTTPEQAYAAGLSTRFSSDIVEQALEIHQQVPLPEGDHTNAIRYVTPDPIFAFDSLVAWGAQVGVPEPDVRSWAWWRGMIDGEMRTAAEVNRELGRGGIRKVRQTDRAMFSPFMLPEQDWTQDQDSVRARAFRYLVADGSLVAPNQIDDIIDRAKREYQHA